MAQSPSIHTQQSGVSIADRRMHFPCLTRSNVRRHCTSQREGEGEDRRESEATKLIAALSLSHPSHTRAHTHTRTHIHTHTHSLSFNPLSLLPLPRSRLSKAPIQLSALAPPSLPRRPVSSAQGRRQHPTPFHPFVKGTSTVCRGLRSDTNREKRENKPLSLSLSLSLLSSSLLFSTLLSLSLYRCCCCRLMFLPWIAERALLPGDPSAYTSDTQTTKENLNRSFLGEANASLLSFLSAVHTRTHIRTHAHTPTEYYNRAVSFSFSSASHPSFVSPLTHSFFFLSLSLFLL